MPEQAVIDDELVRMIRNTFGDYHDPRLAEVILLLVRKEVFSVADVKELIRSCEEEAIS